MRTALISVLILLGTISNSYSADCAIFSDGRFTYDFNDELPTITGHTCSTTKKTDDLNDLQSYFLISCDDQNTISFFSKAGLFYAYDTITEIELEAVKSCQ